MTRALVVLFAALISCSRVVAAEPPDIAGVYQAIPDGTTVPGGLRNEGSPEKVALQQTKPVDLKRDPAKMCQPIGECTGVPIVNTSWVIAAAITSAGTRAMRSSSCGVAPCGGVFDTIPSEPR